MFLPILKDAGMEMNDVMEIITAVGNHEEQSGTIPQRERRAGHRRQERRSQDPRPKR